jgi:hypothetical protein
MTHRRPPTSRLPLAACTIAAKYLYNQITAIADDEGRLTGHPGTIIAKCYEKDDVTYEQVAAWIDELRIAGALQHYRVREAWYIAITNFAFDNHRNHPKKSKLPKPPEFRWPPESPGVPVQFQLNFEIDELAERRRLTPRGSA